MRNLYANPPRTANQREPIGNNDYENDDPALDLSGPALSARRRRHVRVPNATPTSQSRRRHTGQRQRSFRRRHTRRPAGGSSCPQQRSVMPQVSRRSDGRGRGAPSTTSN
jgi:hypothetical protein